MGRKRKSETVNCGKHGCGKPSVVRHIPTWNNAKGSHKRTMYLYWVHIDKKSKPIKHYIGPAIEHPSKTNQNSPSDLYWSEEDEIMYKQQEPKISMTKPEPRESRMYDASADLSDSLLKLGQDWRQLTKKIKQFPPNDITFDRRVMVRLHRFKGIIDNLDSYIKWLSDEKFTNSIFEWISIKMRQEYNPTRAKNSATMDQIRAGMGLPPVTTKHNKMTKKGINKNLEKMEKRINDLVDSLSGFNVVKNIAYDLSLWRDEKSQFPRAIKEHKKNVGEKQSDSAYWRTEGIEERGSFRIDEYREKNRRNKVSKKK